MKKLAVITGASSGMGREAARQLAEKYKDKKMEFWLIGRDADRLGNTAAAVEKYGHTVCVMQGDLCDREFIRQFEEKLCREHTENHAGIAWLVNAAGFGINGRVEEISPETLGEMVELNDRALMQICRISLSYMIQESGRIVNFASASAFLPQPGFAVYAASKAFVYSFSVALASELKKYGIGVTAVCAGPVKTEFFRRSEKLHAIPFYKRLFMARPENVVRVALLDAVRRKRVSVYGIPMKLLFLISRFIPAAMV